MKTIEHIQEQINQIDKNISSNDFNQLSEKEKVFVKAISDSCKDTLKWVLGEDND